MSSVCRLCPSHDDGAVGVATALVTHLDLPKSYAGQLKMFDLQIMTFSEEGMRLTLGAETVLELRRAPPPPAPRINTPSHIDNPALRGSVAKINRARQLLVTLMHELNDHLFKQKGFVETQATDPFTGETVFLVRMVKPLPDDVNAIVGDIVHNLRSSLDVLVSNLVRANSNQIWYKTSFPIVLSPNKYEKAAREKLKGVSPAAETFIRRLRPWGGGSPVFSLLSELNNQDKHDDIIPVVAARMNVLVEAGMRGIGILPDGRLGNGPGAIPFGQHLGPMVADGPMVEIDAETEVLRIHPDLARGYDVKFHMNLTIMFGGDLAAKQLPIVYTLEQMADAIERILDIVDRKIIQKSA